MWAVGCQMIVMWQVLHAELGILLVSDFPTFPSDSVHFGHRYSNFACHTCVSCAMLQC